MTHKLKQRLLQIGVIVVILGLVFSSLISSLWLI